MAAVALGVSNASPAFTKSPYRPEIDGLRALAVVAVIINHFNKDILPSGYLGVDIFFVISGYVITSSLAGRSSKNFSDFLIGFYARRIKRLVPALVLFVGITSVLVCLVDPDPGVSLRTGATSLFGLSNLYLLKQSTDYFATSTELNVFTHTWSLGVEEQFYLLFPFLIWFSGFGRLTVGGARNLFWSTTLLSVASLLCFIYLYPSNQSAAYFLMPTRLWELGSGCLLFLSLRNPSGLLCGLEALSPLVVTAVLIGVLFLPFRFAVVSTFAVVLLTVCLLACLRSGTVGYLLFTQSQVIYVGLISYSLYLWHWSVLSLSRWTIGIHWWSVPFQAALMMLLAVASYRYVETPFRRSDWSLLRWKTIGYGLGSSGATALSVMALGNGLDAKLFALINPSIDIPLYTDKPFVLEKKSINSENCMIVDPHQQRVKGGVLQSLAACSLKGSRQYSQNLFFIGDSQSNHLKALAGVLNSELGVGVQLLAVTSTIFPVVRYSANNGDSLLLNKSRNDAQELIAKNTIERAGPGDIVVLSGRYMAYFGDPRIPLHQRTLEATRYSIESQAKLSIPDFLSEWETGLELLLSSLDRKSVNVVVVLPVPEFPSSGILCISLWSKVNPNPDCRQEKHALTQNRELFVSRITDLSKRHRNLYLYDPFPLLCPKEESCSVISDEGKLLYEDSTHLSNYGSRSLANDFIGFLRRHSLLKKPPA